MGVTRCLWLGLLGFSLLPLGCTSDSDSCGGPTSDFPFCDDGEPSSGNPGEGSEPPSVQVGDPVDVDGDGKPDGRAVDSNADGEADGVDFDGDGAADVPLPGRDAGVPMPDAGCLVKPLSCRGSETPLSATGTAPAGEIRIDSVGLTYEQAFTPLTLLEFHGSVAGEPLAIRAGLFPRGDVDPLHVVPPAVYASPPLGNNTFEQLSCAASSALSAEVVVLEHSEVGLTSPSGILRGELRLKQPGFQLSVPFEITQGCGVKGSP